MDILAQKKADGRHFIWYKFKNYVYLLSSNKLSPEKFIYRGYVCTIGIWNKTFAPSLADWPINLTYGY